MLKQEPQYSKMTTLINKLTHMQVYKCSHCTRYYTIQLHNGNVSGRVPLLLPCGHSMCEECVISLLKEGSVSCLVCHFEVTVTDKLSDLREVFPIDRYLYSVLMNDGNRTAKPFPDLQTRLPYQPAGATFRQRTRTTVSDISNTAKELCSQQQTCSKPAELRCIDCSEVFCFDCDSQIHAKLRILQSHVRLPVDIPDLSDFAVSCKEHPGSVTEYYCNSCQQMLCIVCLIKEHKEDDFISISEKNKIDITELHMALKKAGRVHKVLVSSQENVKENYQDVRQTMKTKDVEFEIKRFFANMHAQLQLRELQLLQDLTKLQNRDSQLLADIAKDVEENIKCITALIATGTLVQKGEYLNKLNVSELIRRINEMVNVPCQFQKNKSVNTTDIKFVVDADVMKSFDNQWRLEYKHDKKYKLVPLSDEQLDESDMDLTDDEDRTSSVSDSTLPRSRHDSVSSLSSRVTLYTYSESACKTRVSLSGAPPNVNIPKSHEKRYEDFSTLSADMTENVIVTHLQDPLNFYIQLTKKKKEIEMLTNKYNKYAENARVPKSPAIGGTYIVQYNSDDFSKWYRAVVKEQIITENEILCEVFYIDYGNSARVPVSMIREITPFFAKAKPFAYKCRIAGITPKNDKFTDDIIQYMIKFITGSTTLQMHLIKKHEDILDVDLISEHESLRTAFAFIGYIDIKTKLEVMNKPSPNVLQQKKIMTGIKSYRKDEIYDVYVTHVENPHCMYIQLMDNIKLICDLETTMSKFYKTNKNKNVIFTPEKGLLCAAQLSFDSKWVRVEVIDLPGFAMVEVFALDHGICETIPWDQIRRLRDNFRQTDAQAIRICLQDVAPVDTTSNDWPILATQFLNDYLKQKYLKMHVNTCAPNQLNITLFEVQPSVDCCINALLVRQGLARSTGENSSLVEYYKNIPDDGKKSLADTCLDSVDTYSNMGDPEEDKLLNTAYYRSIEVLHVESPSCFYITLPEWNESRYILKKELKKFYGNATSPNLKWTINSICVILSSIDQSFHRAIVTEVLEGSNYKVFLKDVIRYEIVPTENMHKMNEIFTKTIDLTVKCFLAGVQPAGDVNKWSNSAIDYFRELVNKYPQLYMTRQGSIVNKAIPVTLFSKWEEDNGPLKPSTQKQLILNKCLLTKGLALPDITEADSLRRCDSKMITESRTSSEHRLESDSDIKTMHGIDSDDTDTQDDVPQSPPTQNWVPNYRIKSDMFKAWITYVDSNGHIYFHTANARMRVNNVLRVMNNHFLKTIPEPYHSWEPGQMCTVQYHLDKNFCRGTVLDTTPDGKIIVKLVDYGNEEECTHDELRSEVLLTDIPILCNEVILADVEPKTTDGKWPVLILDTLHFHIVDKECHVTVIDSGSENELPSVLLRQKNININEMVINWNWTQAERATIEVSQINHNDDDASVIIEDEMEIEDISTNMEQVPTFSTTFDNMSFKCIEIPDQRLFNAVIVSLLDYQTVMIEAEFVADILKDTEEEFVALMTEINAYADKQPLLSEFGEGVPCVALYADDAQWYRAEICNVEDTDAEQLQVLFVDYGNMETVSKENVHKCPNEWMEFPVQMLRCKISGIEKNNNCDSATVLDQLSEVLLDRNVLVHVITQEPKLEVQFLVPETSELAYQELFDKEILFPK